MHRLSTAFRPILPILLCVSLPIVAIAADGAKLFMDKGCVSCHGPKGEGVTGLAPPLKGSSFVTTAPPAEVKETIIKGRMGKNRRHPNIPGGMPPNSIPDNEADALVSYLKGDLQK